MSRRAVQVTRDGWASKMAQPDFVIVAIALGWSDVQVDDTGIQAWGRTPEKKGGLDGHGLTMVPHFDKNWDDLGPLIEKYGISLRLTTGQQDGGWTATSADGLIVKTGNNAKGAVFKTVKAILGI